MPPILYCVVSYHTIPTGFKSTAILSDSFHYHHQYTASPTTLLQNHYYTTVPVYYQYRCD